MSANDPKRTFTGPPIPGVSSPPDRITYMTSTWKLCGVISLLVWSTASSDSDGEWLDRLVEDVDSNNVHAVLVFQRGDIVLEHYSSGRDEAWDQDLGVVNFDAETLHDLRSGTKSIVAALVGIAIAEGKIPELDTPVADLLDEEDLISFQEPREGAPLRLRHLLSMTAGFDWNENVSYQDPDNSEIRMWQSESPVAFALSQPYADAPGTRFRYNGGLTQVLIAIVERNTGVSADTYAKTKLFDTSRGKCGVHPVSD